VIVEMVAPQFVVPPNVPLPTASATTQIPQPQVVSGLALIDSGASHTSIDTTVAQQLSLNATGAVPCMSASGPYNANQYALGYRFQGYGNYVLIPVTEAPNLAAQNLVMLIGRDLLASCVLVYNGATGAYSLSW